MPVAYLKHRACYLSFNLFYLPARFLVQVFILALFSHSGYTFFRGSIVFLYFSIWFYFSMLSLLDFQTRKFRDVYVFQYFFVFLIKGTLMQI